MYLTLCCCRVSASPRLINLAVNKLSLACATVENTLMPLAEDYCVHRSMAAFLFSPHTFSVTHSTCRTTTIYFLYSCLLCIVLLCILKVCYENYYGIIWGCSPPYSLLGQHETLNLKRYILLPLHHVVILLWLILRNFTVGLFYEWDPFTAHFPEAGLPRSPSWFLSTPTVRLLRATRSISARCWQHKLQL